MSHPKNLLWTPAPTYGYSIDKAVILTTLKQGTTYLSKWVYDGLRPRYNFDLLNNDVVDFPVSDISGGDWRPNPQCDEERITRIKQSSLIDLNLILMGNNVKKTVIIIRNPLNRLVSSILEDTIRWDGFLKDGRMNKLNLLYDSQNISMPQMKYKNNTWEFENDASELQNSIYLEYILSQWIAMAQDREFPGALHYINQWESFVYSLIGQENFNKNKLEIVDIDETNLSELLIKYSMNKDWDVDVPEKIHTFADSMKEKMIFHINNRSKFRNTLQKMIRVDSWFYQLIKKQRVYNLVT